jgi:hypothetical protein
MKVANKKLYLNWIPAYAGMTRYIEFLNYF